VIDVTHEGVGHRKSGPDRGPESPPRVAVLPDLALDLLLLFVGEFGSLVGEELDPVVLGGVVGGTDDRTEIGARLGGEPADAAGGEDADVDGIHPDGVESGLERQRQHLP